MHDVVNVKKTATNLFINQRETSFSLIFSEWKVDPSNVFPIFLHNNVILRAMQIC